MLALAAASTARGQELPVTTPAVEQPAEPSFLDRLRQGGFVIYLRHATTDFSQVDSDVLNLGNCATQRNLTDVGRAQAVAIGETLRALAVPIGEVLSSEYCRTLETAWLAFGRATPSRELTGISGLTNAERDRRLDALRAMLATPPADPTNTVLVAHQFNLRDAVGVTLINEGDAAVYAPDGAGGTSLARVVLANEWAQLARRDGHASAPPRRGTARVLAAQGA
jgi:broad specificity phosphatase PhoE